MKKMTRKQKILFAIALICAIIAVIAELYS